MMLVSHAHQYRSARLEKVVSSRMEIRRRMHKSAHKPVVQAFYRIACSVICIAVPMLLSGSVQPNTFYKPLIALVVGANKRTPL